jgi:hypothetical protein
MPGAEFSRNFTTEMTASVRLTAGVYFVDVAYQNRANENTLNQGLRQRVAERARLLGGTVSTSAYNNTEPGLTQFTDSLSFQNRGQCIAFCQGVGHPQDTFSVYFKVDAASLIALP